MELFRSAIRDDFRDDGDTDLLASIRPGAKCGLFEGVELKEGLQRILGRSVDLVSRRAIARSTNSWKTDEMPDEKNVSRLIAHAEGGLVCQAMRSIRILLQLPLASGMGSFLTFAA